MTVAPQIYIKGQLERISGWKSILWAHNTREHGAKLVRNYSIQWTKELNQHTRPDGPGANYYQSSKGRFGGVMFDRLSPVLLHHYASLCKQRVKSDSGPKTQIQISIMNMVGHTYPSKIEKAAYSKECYLTVRHCRYSSCHSCISFQWMIRIGSPVTHTLLSYWS